MAKKYLEFDKEKLELQVCAYESNNRLAILCDTKSGENYCDITINLPECPITDPSHAFLSDNGEIGQELIELLKEIGIIKLSGAKIPYNMGQYELVSFSLDKLKEYDPKGTKEFMDLHPDKFKAKDKNKEQER